MGLGWDWVSYFNFRWDWKFCEFYALIYTKINYSMTCSEFKNFVANNTKFINAAESTDKCSFK
jgi:hypothetical protein